MAGIKASANAPSGRMFESDFFEFFSHIHPWQPPLFFIPLIGWAFYMGASAGAGVLALAGTWFAGVVIWSLLEYWLHRKLFHYEPTSKVGKRFIWLLHGVHHDWPHDKLRLVFPPTLSLPIAAAIYAALTPTVGEVHRYGVMAGVASGYLAYDMIHYWVHHFAPKSRIGKFLRRYHLAHHFKDPDHGFGVSNPLWDYVFGTAPKAKVKAAEPEAPTSLAA